MGECLNIHDDACDPLSMMSVARCCHMSGSKTEFQPAFVA